MKCVELTSERERLIGELAEFRKQGQVRVGFLEDQNKLLRDEIADHGNQWKAEKKLLVKEIKNLRSNVAVLQAEGRGMQSELTRLKRELS
jgi:predicted  nucleic acid-binding Zn-ribbon protein